MIRDVQYYHSDARCKISRLINLLSGTRNQSKVVRAVVIVNGKIMRLKLTNNNRDGSFLDLVVFFILI